MLVFVATNRSHIGKYLCNQQAPGENRILLPQYQQQVEKKFCSQICHYFFNQAIYMSGEY